MSYHYDYIMNHILAQSPDEFLLTFDLYNFLDTQKLDEFKRYIKEVEKIGINVPKGGVGKVYMLPNTNYVIKKSEACPDNVKTLTDSLLINLCAVAKSGIIFRIPNTISQKTVIIGPDHLIENIVGMLIFNKTKKYTSSFSRINGFQYDIHDSKHTIYTSTEPLIEVGDTLKDPSNFLYMMFQLTHAIHVAQKTSRYVHYDLHRGNIMIRNYGTSKITAYSLENGQFLYTHRNFDYVIIDYGHNRMETSDTIIIPKMSFMPYGEIRKVRPQMRADIVDQYEFNPYYDIFTLLYTYYIETGKYNNDSSAIAKSLIYKFFNFSGNDADFKTLINPILINKKQTSAWRVHPEKLMTDNPSMSTPLDMMIYITDIISKYISKNPTNMPADQVYAYLSNNAFYISDQMISTPSSLPILRHSIVPAKLCMDNTFYKFKVDENKSGFSDKVISTEYFDRLDRKSTVRKTCEIFNNTAPDAAKKSGSLANQHYHVATINQSKGLKNGYKFKFDCCRLDVRNVFQNTLIKSGIAINGSFFRIKDNFMPMGDFKTDGYTSSIDIPEVYKKYFGAIVVKENGLLDIEFQTTFTNNPQYIYSGPVLVLDGRPIFNEKVFNDLDDNKQFIFQSRSPNKGEESLITFSDGMHNADRIGPSELYHASNPNPRSALLIDRDNNIKFVYVEGRDNRGDGMDLAQLAQLCIDCGAVKAINLDGGRSSQFMWKKPGETYIYEATPGYEAQAYPVGTVISFIKK